MPPKDQPPRRRSTPSQSEHPNQRAPPARRLITFVDSQDPNSRSAIQRHTAHHSNAQRRNARLQSLRSDRPRLLEWQRRPRGEADMLSVRSPQSSSSSASLSPAPGLQASLSAPGDISAERRNVPAPSPERATSIPHLATEHESADERRLVDRSIVEEWLNDLCPYAAKDKFWEVINYIDGTCDASRYILSACVLVCRGESDPRVPTETDRNEAQDLYGQGTRLLRDRLMNPQTASSDSNIQAVLLFIAYASDTGSTREVAIHLDALSQMIRERGGLQTLMSQVHPTLKTQLEAISKSRRRHLTLDCRANCPCEARFPNGLTLFNMQNEM